MVSVIKDHSNNIRSRILLREEGVKMGITKYLKDYVNQDREGAEVFEYVLIVSLLVALIIVLFAILGPAFGEKMNEIANNIRTSGNSMIGIGA